MIGYLEGTVTHTFRDSCFVNVRGVGYRTYAPLSTLEQLTPGREVLLYTYMNVREDAILLYGFLTQDEYDLFMLLIGVNGVGPKVALGILSAVQPDGFRVAVQKKDMSTLTKMPGIGKKTAERIVLELQDKIGGIAAGAEAEPIAAPAGAPSDIGEEALAALCSLGYTTQEAEPLIAVHQERAKTVEELIRAVLRALGTRR